MSTLKAVIVYPIFLFLWSFAMDRKIVKDGQRWCEWKKKEFSKFRLCVFFIEDRAFRNLFYYRVGFLSHAIAWILPGYDHLQITTPRESIGGGLILQHGFATIISAESIGENCKIYQQVTIGYNHRLEAPVLGDNVEVCCGAKIIGGVHIGNRVVVGANAVVVDDVPDNCTVAGVPAKIVERRV